MKIGYLRYSQSLELDLVKASARMLSTDVRLGFIEGLLQLGHEVHILSPVSRKHLGVFKGEGEFFDYSIFEKVIYSPEKIPELDLLFIEASTVNLMFGGEGILRTRDVLSQYEGKVAVYQLGDKPLGFPLGAVYDGEGTGFVLPEGAKEPNYKTLFRDVDYSNKEWILIGNFIPDTIVKHFGGVRFQYDRFNRIVEFDIGFSKQFDRINTSLVKRFRKRDYDLVYIGHGFNKHRSQRTVELYGDDDCKRLLYGIWDDPPKTFDYQGFVPGHGKLYTEGLYTNARVNIVTGSEYFYDTGFINQRIVQGTRSGTVTFIDAKYRNKERYFAEKFWINNHEEMHDTLKGADLYELWWEQWQRLLQWKTSLKKLLKELK